ncbi:hypothetical protein YTPLAS72_12430 [Nitrospira sp.]|nr:hypothetical protein YTPLAS72_12430 [Nitrospira sp.]
MPTVTAQVMPSRVSELIDPALAVLLDTWFMGSLPRVTYDSVTQVFASRDSEFRLHVFQ